jgi:hypothetical protein
MRPQTSGPWRKTLRREAKGTPGTRRARQPEPSPIYARSTWMRRHQWMPRDLQMAIYEARVVRDRRAAA